MAVAGGVPQGTEREMELFKGYVVFCAQMAYRDGHVTIQDPSGRKEKVRRSFP